MKTSNVQPFLHDLGEGKELCAYREVFSVVSDLRILSCVRLSDPSPTSRHQLVG